MYSVGLARAVASVERVVPVQTFREGGPRPEGRHVLPTKITAQGNQRAPFRPAFNPVISHLREDTARMAEADCRRSLAIRPLGRAAGRRQQQRLRPGATSGAGESRGNGDPAKEDPDQEEAGEDGDESYDDLLWLAAVVGAVLAVRIFSRS